MHARVCMHECMQLALFAVFFAELVVASRMCVLLYVLYIYVYAYVYISNYIYNNCMYIHLQVHACKKELIYYFDIFVHLFVLILLSEELQSAY